MGWNGELGEACAPGESVTYTPDTTAAHGYTAGTFTAPKRGVYRFTLKGSGGLRHSDFLTSEDGGEGGQTVGYLLLDKGQQVFVGCGGPCSAAWVASANPGNTGIWDIAAESLYFVAGGGGGGGCSRANTAPLGKGGAGGGSSGAQAAGAGYLTDGGGRGGTQSAGGVIYEGTESKYKVQNGAYGKGGTAVYTVNDYEMEQQGGDGGDGYYGGSAGMSPDVRGSACGGGGGSGYVYAQELAEGGRRYACTTQQGGGAASNTAGSVTVTAPEVLPVRYRGTALTKIIFDGVEVSSLIYNGTTIFARRCRGCLKRLAARFACLRATRGSSALRRRAQCLRRETSPSSPCASAAES